MTTTRSDCGCGHVAASATGTAAAIIVGDPRVGAAERSGAPGTPGAVDLGGFRALNPVDGLFLRASHLQQIQDYARSLVTALATSGGTGVVHGLGVRLVGAELEVAPGLAVSPRGRLLLLTSTLRMPLDESHVPARTADGFWRVELHWASGTSGSAPVYGSLCNDSCADGGATIQPWRDEGVELRLVTDVLPGLDGTPLTRRRNWLASAYFERERASGQPWLVPIAEGSQVALAPHDWEDGTPLPTETGVPLGLLQSVAAEYVLDVWAARRLVDGPASGAAWQERLAMRPWAVFLAQVLQFQAEVTGVDLVKVENLMAATQRFLTSVKEHDPVRSRGSFRDLEKASERLVDPPSPAGKVPGVAAIGELPPAGFLGISDTSKQLQGDLAAFFGPNVDLRLRRLRADQVADEVLAAQSRDRIPLEPFGGRRPQVDILIPAEPADKADLATASYNWVAFVRRGPVMQTRPPLPPPTDEVTVMLLSGGDWQRFSSEFTDGDLADAVTIGALTFPRADWAYPGGDVAMKTLAALGKDTAVALVALTRGEDRPLAAVRAGLFGTSLDSGNPLPVYAHTKAPVDAIIVVAETD